jgi:hypothetical protein
LAVLLATSSHTHTDDAATCNGGGANTKEKLCFSFFFFFGFSTQFLQNIMSSRFFLTFRNSFNFALINNNVV